MKSPIVWGGCLLACAHQAAAQPEQPQFYFWNDRPREVLTYADHQFEPFVRINITLDVTVGSGETHAEATARTLKEDIEARVSSTCVHDRIDPARVAVLLQNLGGYDDGDIDQSYSFFQNADRLSPPLDEDDVPLWGEAWSDEFGTLRQPWMTKGRAVVTQWMHDFLAAYDADPAINPANSQPIIPVRFHFDNEYSPVLPYGTVGWTRLMMWAGSDVYSSTPPSTSPDYDPNYSFTNRYGTLDVPGYPAGTTLEVLWAAACNEYGWNPQVPLYGAPNDLESLSQQDNKKYTLWWIRVWVRVMAAHMNDCVYAPIKDAVSPSSPLLNFRGKSIKVGNYNYTKTDGQQGTFGWRYMSDVLDGYEGSPGDLRCEELDDAEPGCDAPFHVYGRPNTNVEKLFTNQLPREAYERDENSGDSAYPRGIRAIYQNESTPLVGKWLFGPAGEKGELADFSSPVYYPVRGFKVDPETDEVTGRYTQSFLWHQQMRWYEPAEQWLNDPYDTLKPETPIDVSIRYFRHLGESVAHSGSVNSGRSIVPWIPHFLWQSNYLFPQSAYDDLTHNFRRILLLNRSMQNEESLVFNSLDVAVDPLNPCQNDPNGQNITLNNRNWQGLIRTYRQVYEPYLRTYSTTIGVNDVGTPYDPARLWYTVRINGNPYHATAVASVISGPPYQTQTHPWARATEVVVTYDNFNPDSDGWPGGSAATLGPEFGLHLEGSIEVLNEQEEWRPPLESHLAAMQGRIYFYNFIDKIWEQPNNIDDFAGLQVGKAFALTFGRRAVLEEPNDGTFRREWPMLTFDGAGTGRFISSEHTVKFKVVFLGGSGFKFRSSLDLVQLFHARNSSGVAIPPGDGEGGGGEGGDGPQGMSMPAGGDEQSLGGPAALFGDRNFDGVTDEADAIDFLYAWSLGESAEDLRADYNGDGVIDEQDIEDYFAAFEQAP